ncbi:MAG: hypothetical protein AAFX87_22025 [Bacteroidota bacterium]
MRNFTYVLIVVSALIISSCALPQMVKLAEQQQLTVSPNPLEVHADTVNFEMAANLPLKMLKKDHTYTISTYYKYGESELELDPIAFKLEDFPNADSEQPRQNKDFSFAYSPAMKQGTVEIKGTASNNKNGKSKETERLEVAVGIITTSKLVQNTYYPAFAEHGYNTEEELIPTNVDFFFDQGRSNLKYSERRRRGQQFEAFIAEKNVTRTVTITGTHSPEGAERINSDLSKNRAEEIETFYRRNMKKFDYQGLADSINFILKPIIEDWADFKTALNGYEGISSDEKSEFLNIVNGAGEFEDKEKALRKLTTYKKVFKDLYPQLRTAQTEILTVKPKKSAAEISVLAKQIVSSQAPADTLSEEEMMYAATLTPSLSEKESIYKEASKKSDSWNSHNNLAAVYIAMAMENPSEGAKYAELAETQLDIANNKKESAEAYANLGSVYLMQGNAYKAHDALEKANSMGPSSEVQSGLNSVKGVTEIMMADYGSAIQSTTSGQEIAVNLFNKGLAQLLNKDFENAVNSFAEATEKDGDFALAYYGAAVAQARLSNETAVIENLTSAVSKDPSLKQKAIEDLEFRNYAANEAFRNALK